MGDSHARMYLPALRALAEDRSFTLSAAIAPGCPWQQGIIRTGEGQIGNEVQDLGPPCRAHHADWYDTIIPALDPDIVILANQPWDDPSEPRSIADEDTGPVDTGSDAFAAVVNDRTQAAVEGFRADGRTVVIIEPVPMATRDQDPLVCLSEAVYLDACRFVTFTRATPVEQAYRSIAATDPERVHAVDIDELLCPYLPICDPVVGGLIVRWDPAHLTETFAATLAQPLGTYFDDAGILP